MKFESYDMTLFSGQISYDMTHIICLGFGPGEAWVKAFVSPNPTYEKILFC
jgi:hypothetical protein